MVTKAELNGLTALAKEQILKDRLSALIEKTNAEMMSHAGLGLYHARISWPQDLFRNTGVGYGDFVEYISHYYRRLGYEVNSVYRGTDLDISWE